MRSYVRYSSLAISLAISSLLYGCFSSTKEVDTVPAPSPIVQVPAPVVVAAPAPVVRVPAPVVVAGPASTTTSTSWGNGLVEQKKTVTAVDGTPIQKQTTTTWNNGDPSSETTTTTTTNPY
jgi:hypothetical protein